MKISLSSKEVRHAVIEYIQKKFPNYKCYNSTFYFGRDGFDGSIWIEEVVLDLSEKGE